MNEDEVIEWNPNAEQFERFRAREVELCLKARRRDPKLKPIESLFSIATWVAASSNLNWKAAS